MSGRGYADQSHPIHNRGAGIYNDRSGLSNSFNPVIIGLATISFKSSSDIRLVFYNLGASSRMPVLVLLIGILSGNKCVSVGSGGAMDNEEEGKSSNLYQYIFSRRVYKIWGRSIKCRCAQW